MSNNTTATKPKPKPQQLKAMQPKVPAVPKELNAPSKVKLMRIQKTINACASLNPNPLISIQFSSHLPLSQSLKPPDPPVDWYCFH
ncbi:hypothetical protein EDB19DRAFT_1905990 [Suillus lakei]|nr:hypothetical protein EDB19DRAFT_1905990 [Suillus lakei]